MYRLTGEAVGQSDGAIRKVHHTITNFLINFLRGLCWEFTTPLAQTLFSRPLGQRDIRIFAVMPDMRPAVLSVDEIEHGFKIPIGGICCQSIHPATIPFAAF